MAKKNTRRKKKTGTQGRVDPSQELRKGYGKTCQLLRRHMSQMRAATKGRPQVFERSTWRGMPDPNSRDPLLISGMEHVLIWYDSEQNRSNWQDGNDVSIISIGKYHGKEKPEGRGTCHLYEATISQLVDPEFEYGRLLARQKIQGEVTVDEDFDTATERRVILAVNVGELSRDDKRPFKQNKASIPNLQLFGLPVPLKVPAENDARPATQRFREDTLANELSDLEVDRLWELGLSISFWIISPSIRLKWREKERRTLEAKLAELEATLKVRTEELAQAEQAFATSQAELIPRKLDLSHTEQALANAEGNFKQKLAKLRAEIKRQEAESGRLRGLRMEAIKRLPVVLAAGEVAKEKHEEKIVHIQTQEAKVPERIAQLQKQAEELESEWQAQQSILARNFELASIAFSAIAPQHAQSVTEVENKRLGLNTAKKSSDAVQEQLNNY